MQNKRPKSGVVVAAACATLVLGALGASVASAAQDIRTWNGTVDSTLTTTGNWSGGTFVFQTYGDQAKFVDYAGSKTISTGTTAVNAIDFNNSVGWLIQPTTGTPVISIGWNHIKSSGAGTNTISTGVKATGALNFNIGSGNTLVLSGAFNAASQAVDKQGLGTLRITGNITEYYPGTNVQKVSAGTLEIGSISAIRAHWTANGGTTKALATNQFANGNAADYVAVDGTGLIDLNGFSSNAQKIFVGSLAVTGVGGNGGGTFDIKAGNLTGHSLNMKGGTIQGTGTVSIKSVLTTDASDTASSLISSKLLLNTGAGSFVIGNGAVANDLNITGEISGATGIAKSGDGTLRLTAANLYGGGTTITAGKLVADNGSGSATGTGAVTISSGASVGGSGYLGSDGVTVNGTIAPGNSIGDIDLLQNASINGTYLLEADLTGASDLIKVAGQLTLGGASVLDLDSLSALDPQTTYTIATYNTLAGEFFSVDTSITQTHEVDYVTGNSIRLVPVPEPTSLAGVVLGSLLLIKRRRHN